MEQAINWPGTIAGLGSYLQLPTPGIYSISVQVDIFSTGTGVWWLALDFGGPTPPPRYFFRESASEAHGSYGFTWTMALPDGGALIPLLRHDSGANGATAGDGVVPAVTVTASLIGAL